MLKKSLLVETTLNLAFPNIARNDLADSVSSPVLVENLELREYIGKHLSTSLEAIEAYPSLLL